MRDLGAVGLPSDASCLQGCGISTDIANLIRLFVGTLADLTRAGVPI
jgi:hypothetical protein